MLLFINLTGTAFFSSFPIIYTLLSHFYQNSFDSKVLRLIQSAPINHFIPICSTTNYHICQASNSTCSISCNATNSCQNLRINASLASLLNLTCTKPHACENLQITSGPTNETNIHCSHDYSCKNATFNINSTAGYVNLECMQGGADIAAYSCYQATLIADIVSNVDVSCEYLNCVAMNFHVQYVKNAIFMFDYDAARNVNIYGNNVQNELNVFCVYTKACKNTTIYGQGMTQLGAVLNVTCLEPDACLYTQIYCPTGDSIVTSIVMTKHILVDHGYIIEHTDYDLDLYCDGSAA